ncbi:MAG TPA: trypsin-like peptidase domain-containing protein [Pirellulaceae bacterium]|jgi:S1-C subfamily serine protease
MEYDPRTEPTWQPPEPPAPPRVHPLDRAEDLRSVAVETARIRLAWAKLVWLLAFLALLLAISYLVPHIAEQTQYAITRGKQRAEHDFAVEHVGLSPIGEMSRAYQMVSQVVGPSVVHISTSGAEGPILPIPTRTRTRIPTEGQGSGVVMDASGYILTNNHVIRGANAIQISLADGRKVKAVVIGRDGASDLAVLKIDADGLVPAEFADSDKMETGALVWAVGSPFGLERSITSGILSAKHRSGLAGSASQDFLQTDAAVNPGNSGGPLVDATGKVIGINTAIVGDSYQGISFAIPSNVALDIYSRIKAGRGWLGVTLTEMTAERARELGLSEATAVYVDGFYPHENKSPAAAAGVQPGDIVLKWNDEPVGSANELRRLVEKTHVGSKAKLVVRRGEGDLTLEVTVGQRSPNLPKES